MEDLGTSEYKVHDEVRVFAYRVSASLAIVLVYDTGEATRDLIVYTAA